jgi:non-heme chloroperoxidase
MTAKPAIVLIHGLWMTPLCWEHWIDRYRTAGYEVLAPGWPGVDDRSPQAIRADPAPMSNKSIGDIVDHYESVIRALPQPPIIMGHSFGGLFVQILLSRGLGAAGIALCPAQPAGILKLPFSTIKATLPVLSNPFDYASTVKITLSQFYYCFGNHLAHEADSRALYERYAIPSVAHVLWQGALGALDHSKSNDAHVDFKRATRAPLLLLVAGTLDHVLPPAVVHKEYEAYDKGADAPVVEYHLFQGRSHGIVNQDTWEEVADYALAFAEKHTSVSK